MGAEGEAEGEGDRDVIARPGERRPLVLSAWYRGDGGGGAGSRGGAGSMTSAISTLRYLDLKTPSPARSQKMEPDLDHGALQATERSTGQRCR